MPELRKDPIIGRWVIIATERAKRPDQFIARPAEPQAEELCPFCEGNEAGTSPEVYALRPKNTPANAPGWDMRIVSSIAPFLRIEGDLERRGKGIYDVTNGIGAHEVVIETNRHIGNMADLSAEQIARVITGYVARITDLEKDVRFKYVLVFKNHGWQAGAGKIRHCRSQLIATPVNPKRVKEELVGARQYYEYHERCVFCDIVRQEIAGGARIVLDIGGFIAMVPFASRFPFEIWIIPKEHSCDFTGITPPARLELGKIMKEALTRLKMGLNDPSYNYVLHTAPFRRPKAGYWKTIDSDYHWHIEITPRLTRMAGFEWGTGFYICPVIPEEAAKYLREVKI